MPSNSTLAKMCDVFCEYVESKGYYVGVYASESWLNNQLKTMSKSYDRWVANWGTNYGTLQSDKSGAYNLHQFTSEYRLGGKRFDRNIAYIDATLALSKTPDLTDTPKEKSQANRISHKALHLQALRLILQK